MTDRSVQSVDGVPLAVTQRGDPSGPPVVFIHGYPDCKEMWDRVTAELGEDLYLIAYDVRGCGASGAPQSTRGYDLERLGDDLLAVLDAVASERTAHLVGHDWGGLQGWEFATDPRFTGRLASFTAVAAPQLDQVVLGNRSLVRRGRVLQALARARRSWYILALLTPGVPSLTWRRVLAGGRWEQLLRRQGVEPYPHPTLARDAVNGANLYRRNIPRRMARPRSDASAHVPVQLIIPKGDRYIPLSYYDLAARHAPALRRHLVEGPHWLPLSDPGTVARLVREFVDGAEAELARQSARAAGGS